MPVVIKSQSALSPGAAFVHPSFQGNRVKAWPMHHHDFLTLPLADTGIDGLIRWLVEPDPGSVAPRAAAYLNAHTANLALRRESEFGPLLRRMDMVYPDGMSVVRVARRRGLRISERVSAGDFFPRFCWAAASRGRTIALVGSAEDANAGCARHLEESIPALKILFRHHGFFQQDSPLEPGVLESLESARPDITLVGMGSPRQEALALRLRDELALPTVWCVGALFEYYAPGLRRHAPLWMRESGLEWAFRLSQEPFRLGRRYLLGNAEFLLRTRGILK